MKKLIGFLAVLLISQGVEASDNDDQLEGIKVEFNIKEQSIKYTPPNIKNLTDPTKTKEKLDNSDTRSQKDFERKNFNSNNNNSQIIFDNMKPTVRYNGKEISHEEINKLDNVHIDKNATLLMTEEGNNLSHNQTNQDQENAKKLIGSMYGSLSVKNNAKVSIKKTYTPLGVNYGGVEPDEEMIKFINDLRAALNQSNNN